MSDKPKTDQLQLRVSPAEKAKIRRRAKAAGLGISEWVLGKLIPPGAEQFESILVDLEKFGQEQYALADLNDFLHGLTKAEFTVAVSERPVVNLSDYYWNYVAAMIEVAANQKNAVAPKWLREIASLKEPVFSAQLKSIRLHLLLTSPPPFRSRNIFIDSTIGDRL